ncbi:MULTISPECIES: AraC family transcriptional regulator [unclassified Paenibacillus]|uniref:AraC family transcriptional regulator n=1 Tax=unclassified Paenibacillus TaxID=185978 RepID=UPI000FE25686|nr:MULTISPECIES: AraC family transcriptional regulator [unclassified Paenibacillus]MCM3171868.1 AraC family transcriptional regulator [Paenibacillus sp. MER 99-2]
MSESTEYLYDPIQTNLLYLHRVTTHNMGTFYHRHNAYELYVFLRGNVNFYIENRCYHLQPGDLIVLNLEEMHRSFALDKNEYERITINLKKPYLSRLSTATTNLSACFDYRPKGKGNIVHLKNDELQQLLQLTNKLEQALASDDYGADIMENVLISQLLLMTNRAFQHTDFVPTDIMPELVRRTMDYIESNLAGKLTLTHLSEALYTNSSYISRQFNKHTGLTIRAYILSRRIELSKYYLGEGMSITEACYQSGFGDYANFIRSFTKLVGISPGRYIRNGCNTEH